MAARSGSEIEWEKARTEISIEIPQGVFGKEPSAWTKWFVHLWHQDNRVVDECEFRRRAILAFTLKWFPVLIWTILLSFVRFTVCLLFAAFGFGKAIHYQRIFRPYDFPSLQDHLISKNIDNNMFMVSWTANRYVHGEKASKFWGKRTELMLFTLPFIPGVLMLEFIIGAIISAITNGHVPALIATLVVVGVISFITIAYDIIKFLAHWAEESRTFFVFCNKFINAIERVPGIVPKKLKKVLSWYNVAITLFVAAIVVLLGMFPKAMGFSLGIAGIIVGTLFITFKAADWLVKKLENSVTATIEENKFTNVQELLCPVEQLNKKPTIKMVPPKRRSIRLRYLDLKNKVCKPMQM